MIRELRIAVALVRATGVYRFWLGLFVVALALSAGLHLLIIIFALTKG
ncbi:hypothetical protein [Novosphingobium sp. FKTRR1]|nr:hypothetical protein [Novosphingobium sp. FKTRR1]